MHQSRNATILRMIFVVAVLSVFAQPSQAKYSGGTGEPNDPYQIATAQDLMALGNEPNDYGRHFVLTADIDLDPNLPGRSVLDSPVVARIDSNAPIVPFSGTFCGNGHSIHGVHIDSADSCVALFGIISSKGQVTGLILKDAYIRSRFRPSRGLVWYGTGLIASKNDGTVSDCNVSGTLTSQVQCGGAVGDNYGHIVNTIADVVLIAADSTSVGGLVGKNDKNASISDSRAVGWIEGYTYTGGLVGNNCGAIVGSHSSAHVLGANHTGGFVGHNSGSVVDCGSTGAVTGSSFYTGGLVGYNEGGRISSSVSSASVKGTSVVGGLVGSTEEHGSISSSYSQGPVDGEDRVGGLLGENSSGSVDGCCSSSTVNGAEDVGGLAGVNFDLVKNSYSTGSVYGGRAVGGLVGSNIKLVQSMTGQILCSAVITNCYSVGAVTGTGSLIGGLVGENYFAAVNNSRWDISTSRQAKSDGGTGLSTTRMQDINTYLNAGWDFVDETANGKDDIWLMPDNDYPMLAWQKSRLAFAYSGGSGSAEAPYQIATAHDLIDLGNRPKDHDKHFILTANIDLAGYTFDRALIAPDGDAGFAGHFDGQQFAIRNLTVLGTSYLGLFGRLISGAVISNVRLEAVDIYGSGSSVGGLVGNNESGCIILSYSDGSVSGLSMVGGLVGHNDAGTITASCSNGSVRAFGGPTGSAPLSELGSAGGLVGWNDFGAITSSCSTCSVRGQFGVGGLVGWSQSGGISMCYSSGSVGGDYSVGGLAGWNQADITSSFWDIETSGIPHGGKGRGLSTAQMRDPNTYREAGWDLVGERANGTSNVWQMQAGSYPSLAVFSNMLPPEPPGAGTSNDPYVITDANELGSVWYRPGAHYRLAADIDLSGITWAAAVVPWLDGSFDGNGHVIRNLHIRGGGYLGLVGQLSSEATISNMGLDTVDIEGSGRSSGALAGVNRGSITASYTSGSVNGSSTVGGLVGVNKGSIISSYSGVSTTADNMVGGIAGQNYGTIASSYSSGAVNGSIYAGGIAGYASGTASACFWDTQTSGQTTSAGGTGKTTAEMERAKHSSTPRGTFWARRPTARRTSGGSTKGRTTRGCGGRAAIDD